MASLGRLTAVLGLDAGEFTAALSKAEHQLGRFADKVGASVGAGLKSFAGQLIAAETAIRVFDAALDKAKSQQKFLSDMDDLAEAAGSTVEKISQLAEAVKIGGKDYNALGEASGKLARGLRGLDEESSAAKDTLVKLGIAARDSTGALRDPADIIRDLAKKLAEYPNSLEKSIVLQQIFGKSGAALAPILSDVAKNIDSVNGVTEESAAAAERLEQAINRKTAAFDKVVRQITIAVTPVLTAMYEVLAEGDKNITAVGKSADTLGQNNSIASFAKAVGENVLTVIDNIKILIDTFERAVARYDLVNAKLQRFKEANKIFGTSDTSEYDATIAKAQERLALPTYDEGSTFVKRFQTGVLVNQALAGSFDDVRDRAAKAGTAISGSLSSAIIPSKKAKKEVDALGEALIKIQNDLNGKDLGFDASFFERFKTLTEGFNKGRLPLDQYRELTRLLLEQQPAYKKRNEELAKEAELQAKLVSAQADITEKLANEAAGLGLVGDAAQKYADDLEVLYAKRKAFDDGADAFTLTAIENEVRKQQAIKRTTSEYQAAAVALKAMADAEESTNRSMIAAAFDRIQSLREETEMIGVSAQGRQLLAVDMRLEAELRKTENEATREHLRLLALQEKAAIATKYATADFYEEIEKKTKQATEDALALEDALGKMAFGGSEGFRSLSDEIENTFKKLAKIAGTKWIIQVATTGNLDPTDIISSVFGGNKESGVGGLLASLFGGGSSGASGGGIGGLLSGLFGGGSGASGLLGSLGGIGSAIATALPYAAVAAAAYAAVKKLDPANTPGTRFSFGESNIDGNARNARTESFADLIFGRIFSEGDISGKNNAVFDPLYKNIDAVNKQILAGFAGVRERTGAISDAVNALKDQDWFKFKDDGSGAIAASTKDVAQRYFQTVFASIDENVTGIDDQLSEAVRNFTGTADELLAFASTGAQFAQLINALHIDESLFADLELTQEGLQKLATNLGGYYQNFYSEQERTTEGLRQLGSEFTNLGVELPASREQFRQLVEAAQAAGDSKLYQGLLDLQGSFAALVPATTALAAASTELQRQMKPLGTIANAVAIEIANGNDSIARTMGAVDYEGATRQINAWRIAILGDSDAGQIAQRAEVQRQADVAWQNLTASVSYFAGKAPEEILSILDPAIFSQLTDAQREWLDTMFSGITSLTKVANTFSETVSAVDVGTRMDLGAQKSAELFGLISEDKTLALHDVYAKQLQLLAAAKQALPEDNYYGGVADSTLAGYDQEMARITRELTNLLRLESQYGVGFGEKIAELDKKFYLLRETVPRTAEELALLNNLYEQQKAAILSAGSSADSYVKYIEKISEAWKSSQQIAIDAINKLRTSNLSPLSEREKYDELLRQFNVAKASATADDPQTVRALDSAASNLLTQAQSFFGSASTEYFRTFATSTQALTEFATLSNVDIGTSIENAGASQVSELQKLREELAALRLQLAQNGNDQIDADYDNTQTIVSALQTASLIPLPSEATV